MFALVLLFLFVCLIIKACYSKKKKNTKPMSVMVVLGSGGHTREILYCCDGLDREYFHLKTFVIAKSDVNSVEKLREYSFYNENTKLIYLTRSRQVHQSYVGAIIPTLIAFLQSIKYVYQEKPNMILCNGPGTCVPIVLAALLFSKLCIIEPCEVVYIESVCRTKTLSLTGKIFYYLVDDFIVCWEQLRNNYPKAVYLGNLF